MERILVVMLDFENKKEGQDGKERQAWSLL